jgi:hypothetical protein
MDWLQGIGDMNVNWLEKRLSLKHQGQQVQLQGLTTDTTSCLGIYFAELEALEESNAIYHLVQLSEVCDKYTQQP